MERVTSPFMTTGYLTTGAAERIRTFVRLLPTKNNRTGQSDISLGARDGNGGQRLSIGSVDAVVDECFDYRADDYQHVPHIDNQLFASVGLRAVNSTLEGFDSCVLDYNATQRSPSLSFFPHHGSVQKRRGESPSTSMVEQCIRTLFDRLSNCTEIINGFSYEVHMECFEALGPRAYELLGGMTGLKQALKVDEHGAVVGLSRYRCQNVLEAMEHIKIGLRTYEARKSTRAYHGDQQSGHLVLRMSITQIKSRSAICTSNLMIVQLSSDAADASGTLTQSLSFILNNAASDNEHTNSPAGQAAIIGACVEHLEAGTRSGPKSSTVLAKILGEGVGGDCKTFALVTLPSSNNEKNNAVRGVLLLELMRHILNSPQNKNVAAGLTSTTTSIPGAGGAEQIDTTSLSGTELRGGGTEFSDSLPQDRNLSAAASSVLQSAVQEAELAREQLASFRAVSTEKTMVLQNTVKTAQERIESLEKALHVAVDEIKQEKERARRAIQLNVQKKADADGEIVSLQRALEWERQNARKFQGFIEGKSHSEIKKMLDEQDKLRQMMEETLADFGRSAEDELRQMQARMDEMFREREVIREQQAMKTDALREEYTSKLLNAQRAADRNDHNRRNLTAQLEAENAMLRDQVASQAAEITSLNNQLEKTQADKNHLEGARTQAEELLTASWRQRGAQSPRNRNVHPPTEDDLLWPRGRPGQSGGASTTPASRHNIGSSDHRLYPRTSPSVVSLHSPKLQRSFPDQNYLTPAAAHRPRSRTPVESPKRIILPQTAVKPPFKGKSAGEGQLDELLRKSRS